MLGVFVHPIFEFIEPIVVDSVFEDLSGAHSAVPGRMVLDVHPDEVVGAVVELVAVEMVADLVGSGHSPERSTDEFVNQGASARNLDIRIATALCVSGLCRAEIGF